MLGNDVVDLALAQKESNWKRNGFLEKIFTKNEQQLIQLTSNPEVMVWNLWSRKEAAYKIYNRETGISGYFPSQIECTYEDQNWGTVAIRGRTYFTKTSISKTYVYTIAVIKRDILSRVQKLDFTDSILKYNGIPFVLCEKSMKLKPASVSHHGDFWEGITIDEIE